MSSALNVTKIKEFCEFIFNLKKLNEKIYIQTHNFPDPDAISSAAGLQFLLKKFDIDSEIIFFGNSDRILNEELIRSFHIKLKSIHKDDVFKYKIAVDGNPINANFYQTNGKFLAFFDHHINGKDKNLLKNFMFYDLRPEIGSTATIIADYLLTLNIEIPTNIATLLLIGLHTDTNGLVRKTTLLDLDIFKLLYPEIDQEKFSFFVNNTLEKKDIPFLEQALKNLKINKYMGITYINGYNNQALSGLIADILLKIFEISFAVVINSINNENILISVRSINSSYNCFQFLIENFEGLGFFGGHREMAGGKFLPEKIKINQILEKLNFYDL